METQTFSKIFWLNWTIVDVFEKIHTEWTKLDKFGILGLPSLICSAVFQCNLREKPEGCVTVPLHTDRREEADADEVSRHRCERPEEILAQIGLLQREVLVRLQTGGDLS